MVIQLMKPRFICRQTRTRTADWLRQYCLMLLCGLLLVTGHTAAAEKQLTVSVDRTQLFTNETLTMTVTGEKKLELSFGSIFNLNSLQLPAPDLGDLEANFEILGRSQKYSVMSTNGDTQARITWTYQLMPRNSGALTIPAFKFEGAQSDPISITVKAGNAPVAGNNAQPAWVEVSGNKASVYVSEQLMLKVKLYYIAPLFNGDLDEPKLDNAFVESVDKHKEYTEYRDGRRYTVVERRYVIYPEAAGSLTVPALKFSGQTRDPVTGDMRFLRAASNPLSIPVKPKPASFTGNPWLPATSLTLSENWSQPPEKLQVGDSVTRTITMTALDLLGSALPPLPDNYPANIKHYADQPQQSAEVKGDSVQSQRVETTSLVAILEGQVTLPEIRVTWWDTLNDQQRVAVIPERTLNILPAAGLSSAPATASSTQAPASPAQTPSPSPSTTTPPPPSEKAAAVGDSAASATADIQANDSFNSMTGWVIGIAALWLGTLLLWFLDRKRRQMKAAAADAHRAAELDLSFKQLLTLAKAGDPEFLRRLPHWAEKRFDDPELQTTSDVLRFLADPALAREVHALEQHLYAAPDKRGDWQSDALVSALKQANQNQRQNSQPSALPPLYPK